MRRVVPRELCGPPLLELNTSRLAEGGPLFVCAEKEVEEAAAVEEAASAAVEEAAAAAKQPVEEVRKGEQMEAVRAAIAKYFGGEIRRAPRPIL